MAGKSPFAGLHLSEQASSPKLDQRLFEQSPPSPPATPPSVTNPTPSPATPPRPASKPKPVPPVTVTLSSLAVKFDLDDEALYKASYVFSPQELEALEDMKLELRRELDTKVTKNDLMRLALHLLIEDYRTNPHRSYAHRKIRR